MSKSLNLIGCQGQIKGKFSKAVQKSSLKNHEWNEVESLHTCLGHYPLHNLCFYSRCSSTFAAMVTYSSHRLTMGKVKNCHLFAFSQRSVCISFYRIVS